MARSDKLYGDSPEIKRGEDGKHKVERKGAASKKHGDMADMRERHMREMAEMHKRHQDETKDVNTRQQAEMDANMPAQSANQGAGGGGEETGATM